MDILQLSALELADKIQEGKLSSVELVRFFLRRIAKFNPNLQAFVRTSSRVSLFKARRADRQRKRQSKDNLPPFHGVPIGIKDLVLTFGVPTHLGSKAYKYFIPPISAPIVKRINNGGFVSLGKLSTAEFGVMPVTEPDIHPPTRNPWNQAHSSGGSSGGSSAAVAAGLLPIAHGSDGGGSIRIPSAFCHLFGFKPSLSLLGNMHGKVNKMGFSTMGGLTKTVADSAMFMDVLAQDKARTCYQATLKKPPPLRIHMCVDTPIGVVDPEIRKAVLVVGQELRKLGHTVVEVPPLQGSIEEFLPLWQFLIASVPSLSEKKLQPITRWIRQKGRKQDFEELDKSRLAISQRIDRFIGDADIVLTPTVGTTAPKVGAFLHEDPEQAFYAAAPIGAFTILFNIFHAPAASIPFGLHSNGLPIGIQIGSRPGKDALVYSLSAQIEEHMPWRQRIAPNY